MLHKLLALLKRDFFVTSSYKLDFLMYWIHALAILLPFFFIARMFNQATPSHLFPYGGDYFAFVLIGLGIRRYLSHALHSLPGAIGEEQGLGTLEALLATPTSFRKTFFLLSLVSLTYATLSLFFYLFLGILLFQVRFPQANWPVAFLILLLTTVTFYAFGLLSASFILVFKKGNVVEPLLEGFSSFLGGVYFPVSLLPSWLQGVSEFVPLTYVLRGLRLSLLQGVPLSTLGKDCMILALLSGILFPVGLWVFGKALRKAKQDGSLVHY
ncbi:MAG: ABC transporter permease [Candidatus Omnitrophica bacterium]|nr:ABC transporter permease [Candidatus Omnitrophota bacterium]